jgi:hypothetical protein
MDNSAAAHTIIKDEKKHLKEENLYKDVMGHRGKPQLPEMDEPSVEKQTERQKRLLSLKNTLIMKLLRKVQPTSMETVSRQEYG